MKTSIRLILTTFVTALLVACGGGGGGGIAGSIGAADATAVIDETNALAIVRAVDESSDIPEGLLLGFFTGIGGLSATASAVDAQNDALSVLGKLVNTTVSRAGTIQPEFSAAVEPVDPDCPGGGTADVVESSTGISINFVDCVNFSYDGLELPGTTDGGLSIELLSGTSLSNFTARVVLTSFSAMMFEGEFMADGTIDVTYLETASQIRYEFTASNFSYSSDGESGALTRYQYDLLLTESTEAKDGVGGVESSEYTGLVVFNITQDFVIQGDDLWPTAGVMLIYGVNNTVIRVTAQPNGTQVLIEMDLTGGEEGGGDGIYDEEYEQLLTWEALLFPDID